MAWNYKCIFFHFLLQDSTTSWVLQVLASFLTRVSCMSAVHASTGWYFSRWYWLASGGRGVKAWNFHCMQRNLFGRSEDYEAAKRCSSSAFPRLQGELELQLTSLLVNPGSLNEPQWSSLPIPWACSHTAHNTLLCMCESTTVHVEGGGQQSHSSVGFGLVLVIASL